MVGTVGRAGTIPTGKKTESHDRDRLVKKRATRQAIIKGLWSHLTAAEWGTRPTTGNKEVTMKTPMSVPFATTAIRTIAQIKAAVEAFDRGESNVFDALDVIVVAVEAYEATTTKKPARKHTDRRAA